MLARHALWDLLGSVHILGGFVHSQCKIPGEGSL